MRRCWLARLRLLRSSLAAFGRLVSAVSPWAAPDRRMSAPALRMAATRRACAAASGCIAPPRDTWRVGNGGLRPARPVRFVRGARPQLRSPTGYPRPPAAAVSSLHRLGVTSTALSAESIARDRPGASTARQRAAPPPPSNVLPPARRKAAGLRQRRFRARSPPESAPLGAWRYPATAFGLSASTMRVPSQ